MLTRLLLVGVAALRAAFEAMEAELRPAEEGEEETMEEAVETPPRRVVRRFRVAGRCMRCRSSSLLSFIIGVDENKDVFLFDDIDDGRAWAANIEVRTLMPGTADSEASAEEEESEGIQD